MLKASLRKQKITHSKLCSRLQIQYSYSSWNLVHGFWNFWTLCILMQTQLIGAYGTQWVPCSFEVWVCYRIIMSLTWNQFSKDTREKLPKKIFSTKRKYFLSEMSCSIFY